MDNCRLVRSMFCGGFVLFILVLFLPVTAFGTPTGPVVINVDVTGGTSPYGITVDTFDWGDVYGSPTLTHTWTKNYGFPGMDIGGAKVGNMSINITLADPHPIVELNFTVTGGSSETTFDIYLNEEISLGAGLTNVEAYANASIGMSFPGNTVTGLYNPNPGGPGNEAYGALYNGSNEFATLVDTPVSNPGSWQEETDINNWLSIPGIVLDMQPYWNFKVTADGRLNTTSRFEMVGDTVPEPASILLIGLGGLSLLKRRRR